MDELRELIVNYNTSPSIFVVLINLFYCIVFGFLLRSFFLKYSTSLVAHNHIANILPMLAVIVFFVILIVKSSIALSLGLVGALSIVRFRTPIKEPEELVYLFFAIAIGLGFGSGQSSTTAVVMIASLLVFRLSYGIKYNKKTSFNEFNLAIEWTKTEASLELIEDVLMKHTNSYKIIKINIESDKIFAMILFEGHSASSIDNIFNNIQNIAPSSSITIHEQLVNW